MITAEATGPAEQGALSHQESERKIQQVEEIHIQGGLPGIPDTFPVANHPTRLQTGQHNAGRDISFTAI